MALPNPTVRKRTVRQQGRPFYITALIITLLACYSYRRGFGNDVSPGSLAARSLEARDLEVCLLLPLATAPYLTADLVPACSQGDRQMRFY